MFSFFSAAVAVYASKTLSDTVASTELGEKKTLLSNHREIIGPLPQLTENDPFINQVTGLLDAKKFNIACKIIALELKKENDSQQLGKIIQLIDQIKQQVSQYHNWDGLLFSRQPRITSELNTLREQAVTARSKQVALSQTNPIPRSASIPIPTPTPTPRPKLSSKYGATQG